MAYFKSNEQEETRRNQSLPDDPGYNAGNFTIQSEFPDDDDTADNEADDCRDP